MISELTVGFGILARWYADPLSHEEAELLLSLCERREQDLLKHSGNSYLAPLLKLIALHWLGEATEGHYQYLISKKSKSVHAEILKPLIHGQLLMSKKIEGAMEDLDVAFHHARLLLRPEDYFVLVKRHQILRHIPLSAQPSQGETLDGLLKTGGVIGRMGESLGGRSGFRHDPDDLYG
ncbi:MAG: hypothetical protein OEZ16_13465 [Chromatiales bacterium]|nr:hypothetical protein [Chromatiales bacterium]